MKQIVIVGAGAMGCLFAARLTEAGVDVTLVDVDRERIDLLNAEGIGVDDGKGHRRVRVPACQAADLAVRPDLVVLFVKAIHSRAAIASVAHLAADGCFALTLQNGLGNAELLAEAFGADNTLLGVTDQPADLHGPTDVSAPGEGRVWLGSLTGEVCAGAQSAAALLNRAGIEARVVADAQAAVWEKAAFNAALNATAMIAGATVGQLDTAEGRRIAAAVVDEAAGVARACGIAVDEAAIASKIDFALGNHRDHKASMLQDRLAGRSTEIDAINGAIALKAGALGIDAPVNATLADLVRLICQVEQGRVRAP
ncbi:MAG: ketopantoate reductase family protein [Sphingomonas sp.]|jgi:2-dehydropantoate 2-reductase|uniref:ketopantoate reductase family protein n=1 Tax=Sphingomonas sp. TaxID=28214 RepID=UPI0035677B78